MSELETVKEWFNYIVYARGKYLETLEKLSPAELIRDRGASFPSILDVYLHSAGAMFFWIGRNISVPPIPRPEKQPGEPPTLRDVRDFEAFVEGLVGRFMSDLRESDLDRKIAIQKDRGQDHDCVMSVRDLLWHLVEEEFQHIGELNALLWQMDVDPPDHDWLDWVHHVGRVRHDAAAGPSAGT